MYISIIENKPYEESKQVLKAIQKSEMMCVPKNDKLNTTLYLLMNMV